MTHNPAAAHPRLMALPPIVIERFFNKVNIGAGCWEWVGSISSSGYGGFHVPGVGTVKAHRVSYHMHKGEIPAGLSVCHSCDNPICVNPDHLFLGTQADNVRDMMNKGRFKNNSFPGEANPAAKLTSADVADIRARFAAGGISKAKIAAEYGLSDSYVSAIISGKAWACCTTALAAAAGTPALALLAGELQKEMMG